MKVNPNRREMLKLTALAAAGAAISPFCSFAFGDNAPGAEGAGASAAAQRKQVLFFTKSSGFQHSVITRSGDDPSKLAYAEQILTDLGKRNGFDVTCSKDGRIFSPENLKKFDVFVFYTTGDLTTDSDKYGVKKNGKGKKIEDKTHLLWKEPAMPAGAKEAFLDAIRNGKGFVGIHSASDTFHSPGHVRGKVDLFRDVDAQGHDEFDPYIQMLGGEFIIHGKQQESTLELIDPKFPGSGRLKDARFVEEWYSLKNFAPNLHVILAQGTQGMNGPMYQRPPYPETWARMHDQGRVFYTSMGHREDMWQRPEYLGLLTGALNWTSRRVDADVTPNLQQATPGARLKPRQG
jgi:type 1 glutamine amidotransferase